MQSTDGKACGAYELISVAPYTVWNNTVWRERSQKPIRHILSREIPIVFGQRWGAVLYEIFHCFTRAQGENLSIVRKVFQNNCDPTTTTTTNMEPSKFMAILQLLLFQKFLLAWRVKYIRRLKNEAIPEIH